MDAARAWLAQRDLTDAEKASTSLEHSDACTLQKDALAHLEAIQQELATCKPDPQHSDLIAIAVDDMKIVTALMKLVVIFGLYPRVPDGSIVPLQPRVAAWKLPPKKESCWEELKETSSRLVAIVIKNDDLSSLVLVSPFLVDIVAATSLFPPLLDQLLIRVPTFALYKVLIQLRALPEPQPSVVKTLGELPIVRPDAVRTLIELVIEPKEQEEAAHSDLSNSIRAAQVLASIPAVTPKVPYIKALGTQLFALLTGSAGQSIAEAAAVVVASLSEIQPKFVGELRNLLVRPLEETGAQAAPALAALLRLAETSEARLSGLFTHISQRICVNVWLLLNASGLSSEGELDAAILALLASFFETSPEKCTETVTLSLTASYVPGTRLKWAGAHNRKPHLIETVGEDMSTTHGSGTLLEAIDRRLDVLVTIISKVSDSSATSLLTFLLRWYTSASATLTPVNNLVLAKAIERLTKDANLRPKLFSDPEEIVRLAFELVTSQMAPVKACEEPRLASLSLEDVDSDDDEEEGEGGDDGPHIGAGAKKIDEESLIMMEMSLSLLGSALMESLGSSEHKAVLVCDEQMSLLRNIDSRYPHSVRSKAQFCLKLLDGSLQEQKEVDMESNTEILKAARSALAEPLVPSRAYGLFLYTKLVERHAIEMHLALSAFLQELRDDDSYVYLNAIKGIETAARVGSSSQVLEFLLPAVDSEDAPLDVVLRAREALVRVVSPGTAPRLIARLVDTLLADLRASARNSRDVRIRMSSCSLLGIAISQFPNALAESQENAAADCALGILRYEKEPEEHALQKAAVILALEIVNAVNEEAFTHLAMRTLSSIKTEIEALMRTTDDATLLEHCQAVMTGFSVDM